MKNKKARLRLSDIEKEGGLDSSSAIPSKQSNAVPLGTKVTPKNNGSSPQTPAKNLTTENHGETDDHMYDVDRSIIAVLWGKFQAMIKRIVKSKWFRWSQIGLEMISLTLVMFYLYFVLDIEKDNSIILIVIMVVFLIFLFIYYGMNIIDHWNDPKMIVDTVLIAIAISIDILEISQRANDKGYHTSGNKFLLNIARVMKGIMLQRRASNFLAKLMNFYKSKKMTKQLKRRNSVTDMLNELLLYVDKDEKFLKKGIHHVKDLVMVERRKSKEDGKPGDGELSDKFGYNHRKGIDDDNQDDDVYALDPDKEDFKKAFGYAKGLTDDKVSRLLDKIEQIDFDIFELRTATCGNELVTVINYLMERHNFYDKLRIVKDKFRKYSIVIQGMYNPIAYHNKTHASDVCQTCYYFMTTCKFRDRGKMTDLDQCVLLISGFVHDTDHPGYNNQYMVSTRDKIALRYNDKSVLENHHISIAFSTMLENSETRIFENFTNKEFEIMRGALIDLVLATDNIRHFSDLNYLNTRVTMPDFDPGDKDKKEITNYLIHLADISNPTKPWKLCYKWIDLLFVEFFHQGDKEREKNVNVSFLMDRYTTNIAGAQGGFIDNFIKPAFNVLQKILPEVIGNLNQMEENKIQWKALEDDYDPKNKFTAKEEIKGVAEPELSIHDDESSEIDDSDGENIDQSLNEEDNILRYSTEEPPRKLVYTHNSSSGSKSDRKSTV
jgi:hypothetical protein